MPSQSAEIEWDKIAQSCSCSNSQSCSAFHRYPLKIEPIKGALAVEEKLQDLIVQVQRCEPLSPDRQKALNHLLIAIQKSPGLLKSAHQDYSQALNRTWEWVSQNIQAFEPRSPSIEKSLVTWINGYLYWRIRDLYDQDGRNCRKYASLDQPISRGQDGRKPPLDQLSNPRPSLNTLEHYIAEQQRREDQLIAQAIRRQIEQDPDAKLTHCHPRKHPDCHCQLFAVRLLLQDPPQQVADLAREFNANPQTLHSHWKKKCRPLLQEIGRNFGYHP